MTEERSAEITDRLRQVREKIAGIADRYRCETPPALIAVSKNFPAADILAAAVAGQRRFGESYVQEARGKIQQLAEYNLEWHFIGPLQSNKTRAVASHFDWVHSIDRGAIARRLSNQRPPSLPNLQICLQVNISGEPSKSGVDVSELDELVAEVADLPRLQLRGLMAIPARTPDVGRRRAAFHALHDTFLRLQKRGLPLDTLSMGMSDDLEAAVAEGSTLVRVGTAIFGSRHHKIPGRG
jgi:pyridoxal phosphate enzyme (YggS family)